MNLFAKIGAADAEPEEEAVHHSGRQSRGKDGRFAGGFAGSAPDGTPVDDANWKTTAQRVLLEKTFPNKYKPTDHGGSAHAGPARDSIMRGVNDSDDMLRRYGVVDAVPGRTGDQFEAQSGMLLHHTPTPGPNEILTTEIKRLMRDNSPGDAPALPLDRVMKPEMHDFLDATGTREIPTTTAVDKHILDSDHGYFGAYRPRRLRGGSCNRGSLEYLSEPRPDAEPRGGSCRLRCGSPGRGAASVPCAWKRRV